MIELIIKAGKALSSEFYQRMRDSILAAAKENVKFYSAKQHIEILDRDGNYVRGRRERIYEFRWYAEDFLPTQRISLGPTGEFKSLEIVKPEVGFEIMGGGIGKDHCIFKVKSANSKPTYGLRKSKRQMLIVNYEASSVYTPGHENEPMSWVFRVPTGQPMPGSIVFELVLPEARPMLGEPRTYKIEDLSRVEASLTDIELDHAEEWKRLPGRCLDSKLDVEKSRQSLRWTISPARKNLAYKVEWDWWL